jgi:hypothetical protein
MRGGWWLLVEIHTTSIARNRLQSAYYFDPLQLATADNFARLREVELKAGRVAMMGVLQTMLIPAYNYAFAHTRNHPANWLGGGGRSLGKVVRLNGGITTNTISSMDILKVVATCLVLEGLFVMPESTR